MVVDTMPEEVQVMRFDRFLATKFPDLVQLLE
jgi:hypothetical protein